MITYQSFHDRKTVCVRMDAAHSQSVDHVLDSALGPDDPAKDFDVEDQGMWRAFPVPPLPAPSEQPKQPKHQGPREGAAMEQVHVGTFRSKDPIHSEEL